MPILHPIFIIILILLIVGSIIEIQSDAKKKKLGFYVAASIILVIATGFRGFVGADYGVYRNMYSGFSIYTTYQDIIDKALFRPTKLDIEWIFVLINRIFFESGFPFYALTFFIVSVSLLVKSLFFVKFSPLPTLSLLMLYMPLFLIAESGQMRQAIGSSFAIFAMKYIVERRFFMFLLFIYIAVGFHKTNIIFLPAYWIVRIPLDKMKIFIAILVSILLSPLELYNYTGSFLENLMPQDIYAGYDGYINDSQFGAEMGFQKTDVLYFFIIYLLIRYNDEACEKIPYYEYFRNLSVFGFCLFFLVKGNRIFAIRLPGVYIFFAITMVMPCIAYVVKEKLRRYSIFVMVLIYSLYITYSFVINNGDRANFTLGKYSNVLFK